MEASSQRSSHRLRHVCRQRKLTFNSKVLLLYYKRLFKYFNCLLLTVLGIDRGEGAERDRIDEKVDTEIEEDLPRSEGHSRH